MGLRLTYLPAAREDEVADLPAQPAAVYPVSRKLKRPIRVVPVAKRPGTDSCFGCIAWDGGYDGAATAVACTDMPSCDRCVYVRATPENKLRHIAWRLENDR